MTCRRWPLAHCSTTSFCLAKAFESRQLAFGCQNGALLGFRVHFGVFWTIFGANMSFLGSHFGNQEDSSGLTEAGYRKPLLRRLRRLRRLR